MSLYVSSLSEPKLAAAHVIAHCFPYSAVVGLDVPHADDNGISRPEQPLTLDGTWVAARLRHAQAKRVLEDARELITFENGIVRGDDLATLCSEDVLKDAAREFGVDVSDVCGDVAAVIWETADTDGFWEWFYGPGSHTTHALSPVRLFPAPMESAPDALLGHFEKRAELRQTQLAAGAARAMLSYYQGV